MIAMTFNLSTVFLFFTFIALATPVRPAPAAVYLARASAAPSSDFHKQNALDAQALNANFSSLTPSSPCTDGQQACVKTSFAQCVSGAWSLTPCSAGTTCLALPLVKKAGTSLSCDSQSDAEARFQAAGVTGGVMGASGGSGNNSTAPGDASGPGSLVCDGSGDGSVSSNGTPQPTSSSTTGNTSPKSIASHYGDSGATGAASPPQRQAVASTIFLNSPKATPAVALAAASATPQATTIQLNRRQYGASGPTSSTGLPVPFISTLPTPSSSPAVSPSPPAGAPAPSTPLAATSTTPADNPAHPTAPVPSPSAPASCSNTTATVTVFVTTTAGAAPSAAAPPSAPGSNSGPVSGAVNASTPSAAGGSTLFLNTPSAPASASATSGTSPLASSPDALYSPPPLSPSPSASPSANPFSLSPPPASPTPTPNPASNSGNVNQAEISSLLTASAY